MPGPPPTLLSKTLAAAVLCRTSSATAADASSLKRGISTAPVAAFPSAPDTPSTSTVTATSTLASQTQDKPKGWGWSRLVLFIPGVATFGLGTWQLFRREEKIKMLEYRQNRLASEPIRGENITSCKDLEFRRVVYKGLFDEKKSIYVGPRSRSISGVTENGYYLITPLVPVPYNTDSLQSPMLVNRGWVPRSWRDKPKEASQSDEKSSSVASSSVEKKENTPWWRFWSTKPTATEVQEQVPHATPIEVVGVVRGSEKPSIFVPANDPSSGQWFYVDVPAIARASGLPENTIYIEDINENINPSHPYPVPKDADTLIRSSVMPQDHLNYTLTWYSLSAAVTFMAFKRLSPKKIRR